ncbi:hypothetical protein [Flavobacterium algicola]|uniref:hypothetical protein n=1 Tax=Flavobacterium algicola TaxID=556529 RepID=UPI001EFD02BF|nr:hypothetical protein [Flavobacterium algicola]MCG9793630.1 hypothetical protein [Flavobacterium algicola]
MKYLSLLLVLVLVSCGKKEDILLPKAAVTVVNDVVDHSPIYLFFRTENKDTLVEVNRKNSIITTNWIFNIDKRLPLKLVIPEVIKLQDKKRKEKAHKNEKAENFYAYADSIGKNMAFLPFTNVLYKLEKPTEDFLIFHMKKGSPTVYLLGSEVEKAKLYEKFQEVKFKITPKLVFLFDKNMSYQEYIEDKILMKDFKTHIADSLALEFIY